MGILQGNAFQLPIKVKDCAGNYITGEQITKGQFIIDDIELYYDPENEGVVTYDDEKKEFLVPLTEEQTFGFKDKVIMWQVRFLFTDGSIDGTKPMKENVYESITNTKLRG